jgi:hypothetical protein
MRPERILTDAEHITRTHELLTYYYFVSSVVSRVR